MIRLEHVTKHYPGGVVALDDVSLEIAKGDFVFLVGASGSGKTTLVRVLLREERISSGRAWVGEREVSAMPAWQVPLLRRGIGCVFQDFQLLPTKTAAENVAFALEVIGRPRRVVRRQVPRALELVGLAGKGERFPHQLSGGEQQRVALARAFINRPLLVLADEPTGNLDPETSRGIVRILDRINRTGTTVVVATHDNQIVDAMRRRVIELESGKVVRDEVRGAYGMVP